MTRDRAGDRLGGARPGAVLRRRAAAAGRGRAGARPGAAAQAAARSCASRCRSCRTSPISTISIRSTPSPRSSWCGCGPARRCPATPISSSCRARRRPSPISPRCAPPAWTSTSPRICAAAAACSACAAATRCSAARIADPDGIEGPAGAVAGLGLLDVETVLDRRQAARAGAAAKPAAASVLRLRDAYGRDRPGRTARGRSRASPTDRRTARSRPTAG